MKFSDFKLSKALIDAVTNEGYETPSPIQVKAIPQILNGGDLMAAAQTGTGKTAGFALPILEKLSEQAPVKSNCVRALILTPTRELAAQVGESFQRYGKHLQLKTFVVFGGVKINPQMMKLRQGVDILVATPGRLLDLANQNAIKFHQLDTLVLDEADRMLDMGFIHDIKKIMRLLPERRQTLLFSATFSPEIKTLATSLLNKPSEISVTPKNSAAVTVKQCVFPVDKKQKTACLLHLLKKHQWQQVLVFTKTKHGANRLTEALNKQGFSALAIHGNKSQGARTRALSQFKSGDIDILVATDLAARGLDIEALPQVVNFELPQVAEDYIHRIGRTGRAGLSGKAFSLVCADESTVLFAIERLMKKNLTREYIDGFIPTHDVPVNKKDVTAPIKPKKPKKPKAPHTGPTNTKPDNAPQKRRRKPQRSNSWKGNRASSTKAQKP